MAQFDRQTAFAIKDLATNDVTLREYFDGIMAERMLTSEIANIINPFIGGQGSFKFGSFVKSISNSVGADNELDPNGTVTATEVTLREHEVLKRKKPRYSDAKY